MSDDPTAALWNQAVEEHIAGMTDTDFADFVSRTRPHTAATQTPPTRKFDFPDPADRQRAILASIQDQQRKRPKQVDANGYPTDAAQVRDWAAPVNTTPPQPIRLPTEPPEHPANKQSH
jgi:hypothetical protein